MDQLTKFTGSEAHQFKDNVVQKEEYGTFVEKEKKKKKKNKNKDK